MAWAVDSGHGLTRASQVSATVNRLLQNEWIHSAQQPADSDAIRWLIAAASAFKIDNGLSLVSYRGTVLSATSQRFEQVSLRRWWDIVDSETLALELRALLGGKPKQKAEYIVNANVMAGPTDPCVERNEPAWDLVRAIHVSASGYLAGYQSREESLATALQAGIALQGIYGSWAEMHEAYLQGYEDWSGRSRENYRRRSCGELRGSAASPFTIDWHTDLSSELREICSSD